MKANYHTHTNLCDGSDAPEKVVKTAISLGMDRLGFSGHMDSDIHMNLDEYKFEVRRLKNLYQGNIQILLGIELDSLYAEECFGKDWMGDARSEGLDYIIGSSHYLEMPDGKLLSVDASEEELAEGCQTYFGGDYYELAKAYYELEKTVIERTHCDLIGHFDLITRFNDSMQFLDEKDPRYYRPALDAMESLVKAGLPFEINCGAVNRGRKKEFYPNEFLLRSLREMGGKIMISSDAHQKELLMGAFEQAIASAKRCGFTEIYQINIKDGKLRWEHECI